MKFASTAILLSALAAASPICRVKGNTVTVGAGHDKITAPFPQKTGSEDANIREKRPPAADHLSITPSMNPEVQRKRKSQSPDQKSKPESVPDASGAGSGQTFSGEGTYYDTGLGACGVVSTDTDFIAAIGHGLFDKYMPSGNPNRNTWCGKRIIAQYEGKSVEVTVVDRCEGCADQDLDFSPAAFEKIADKSLGRIKITWSWA